MSGCEHVVVLDPSGRAVGTVPKAEAHGRGTPLHLAFSCHVVDEAGRVLLARRAGSKRTWPGVWSNACCGHPQVGETLRAAAERRVEEELGLVVDRIAVALPDFTYRAVMGDGTVEHERCPVLVASIKGTPSPAPSEVDAVAWCEWPDLVARASAQEGSLSPWAVTQIAELDRIGPPASWLRSDAADRGQALLDRQVDIGRMVDPPLAPSEGIHDPISDVAVRVEEILRDFLDERAGAVEAIDPVLTELTAAVQQLLGAGGKRLRPAFVHWGHRAAGGTADEAARYPAAAVELLHTFALLHDDVMDRSWARRGRPTAHVALADAHRIERLRGDPAWFGISVAILAGDLVYVWADELLHRAPLAPAARDRARRVFTTLREEVIAGQHLDLRLAADRSPDEARARNVALLKSARYSVTRPLLLGASLAPAASGASVTPALTAYGDAVGMAFQLRDDILGLFGDPAVTGKSCLDDLHEGKQTMLVLRALRLADQGQRALLEASLGDRDLDDEGAARVREVVAATGALASVEALLVAQHAQALEVIDDLPTEPREALTAMAQLAIRRSA